MNKYLIKGNKKGMCLSASVIRLDIIDSISLKKVQHIHKIKYTF